MGMDAYLYKCKSLKQIKEYNFITDDYADLRNEEAFEQELFLNNGPSVAELWYGRKFWDLHTYITTLIKEPYENGDYVEITKDMLEKIVMFAALHPDYFGGFDTVPQLCRALYHYDEIREKGWIIVYECDW